MILSPSSSSSALPRPAYSKLNVKGSSIFQERKLKVSIIAALPVLLLGISVGWLLGLLLPSSSLLPTPPISATRQETIPPIAIAATSTNSVSKPNPFLPSKRGHVHNAIYEQALSHVAFHSMAFKKQLASLLVPKQGMVVVVGVEHGAEVIALAGQGYEVHAFEAMQKYYDGILAKSKRLPNLHPYHMAVGSESTGSISLRYQNGPAETVKLGRLDTYISGKVNLLSIDIQGNEYDVVLGASKLKVDSFWVEIFPCNKKVTKLFAWLHRNDYVIFDFVPWGSRKRTHSAQSVDQALSKRPTEYKQYLAWFCGLAKQEDFTWVQSDILAVKRELVTKKFLRKINSIGNDVIVSMFNEGKKKHFIF